MVLQLTARHLRDGVSGETDKCAVALASRDAFPGVSPDEIEVEFEFVRVGQQRIATPADVELPLEAA